jgi:sarcosine oxidase subunit gamma
MADVQTPLARISLHAPQGMITLRGDLSDAVLQKAATDVAGVDMPGQREARCAEDRAICWMSPDELLVMCPHDAVSESVAAMQKALAGQHALVVDVSDTRSNFRITGKDAREVLAKTAPVDLAPGRFDPPMFRRTRLAQVPAAFWMRDEETFQLFCLRSHTEYVQSLLETAADAAPTGLF